MDDPQARSMDASHIITGTARNGANSATAPQEYLMEQQRQSHQVTMDESASH